MCIILHQSQQTTNDTNSHIYPHLSQLSRSKQPVKLSMFCRSQFSRDTWPRDVISKIIPTIVIYSVDLENISRMCEIVGLMTCISQISSGRSEGVQKADRFEDNGCKRTASVMRQNKPDFTGSFLQQIFMLPKIMAKIIMTTKQFFMEHSALNK